MTQNRLWTMLTLAGALALPLAVPSTGFAQDASKAKADASKPLENDESMLDEVTLANGRQFVGRIVEETADVVTMEIVRGKMKTKMTWPRKEILEIRHDTMPDPDGGAPGDVQAGGSDTPSAVTDSEEAADPRRVAYRIPVTEWFGMDAHSKIIKTLWNEALESGARTVVFEFDCFAALNDGSHDIEEYRDFFQDIKKEAGEKEIELVAWVKRSYGLAVAYTFMFETIYFQPDGEIGGGQIINDMLTEMFSDENVRAKMISAWVGICRGMAEDGGHSAVLCEAMIRPELFLSYDLHGDEPVFYASDQGEKDLDLDKENAVVFDAEEAARFAISRGTVGSMDDLMFRLGHREYRYEEGNAERLVENWNEGWKDAYYEVQQIRVDMADIDTLNEPVDRKIALKIAKLNDIMAIIRKWPPLAVFYNPEQIRYEIDTLKKELRNINENERGGGGGGGGGSGGGRGGDG